MTDQIKKIKEKLKSAQMYYSNVANTNKENKELATKILNEIKGYKAQLAELKQ